MIDAHGKDRIETPRTSSPRLLPAGRAPARALPLRRRPRRARPRELARREAAEENQVVIKNDELTIHLSILDEFFIKIIFTIFQNLKK